MEIHVVQPGETLEQIARQYGVSVERIAADNRLNVQSALVPGQTLVILYPAESYTVQPGDTLDSIAGALGVPVNQLLRNNPILGGYPSIYPGQTLVVSYQQEKEGALSVNGYVYPFVNRDVLQQALPYLTYLTLFTYGFTTGGDLIELDDEELIGLAKSAGVAPLMHLSTLTPAGNFSSELANLVLNRPDLQEKLIGQVLTVLGAKGYAGLDVDFEFVDPANRQAYIDFIRTVTERLNAEGYLVVTALAPKTSPNQPGLLYEAHDYEGIGEASNAVLLMTYEWGYSEGPPMAVAPLPSVRRVPDYGVTAIPPEKIYMGMPNYGYDWPLPFVRGETKAPSIGNVEAVDIARRAGAAIQYDETSQAPHFNYSQNGQGHEVWFEDARSIRAKLALVPEYGLEGVGYWNLMRPFPQNWLVLNALYEIRKAL